MYQVTITFEGIVMIQDIFNKEKTQQWLNVIRSKEGWNISILKLKVDSNFKLKDEFI